jgi:transposase
MPSPLFPDLTESSAPETGQRASAAGAPGSAPRIDRPEREQVKLRALAIDALLPADHQARVVWGYVEGLDLSALEAKVKSVEGHAGRAATDPHLLLALWLFATLDGVGSARQIERLCTEHLAYIWLCGDLRVGRTVLTEFRVENEALLDDLLVLSVASLRDKGLVTLERVSQDGMRVRASAGAGSFRRGGRLETALAEARTQVAALKAELNADPASADRRRDAAKLRGAEDRERRITEALAQMPEIEKVWTRNHRKRGKRSVREDKGKGQTAQVETEPGEDPDPSEAVSPPAEAPAGETADATNSSGKKSAPRASTTAPEARVMKMANSGFRPALNFQIAADVVSLVVLAVDVSNVGSDAGMHVSMMTTVKEKYGTTPAEWLVDGGYPTLDSVEAVPDGCNFVGPVTAPRNPARDPYVPLPGDTPKVAEWRKRMGTEEAKQTYKLRAATSELVNAHMRNRRLRQLPVRGIRRGRCVLLLHALAHNLVRAMALAEKKAA